jgi:hypothetical protein
MRQIKRLIPLAVAAVSSALVPCANAIILDGTGDPNANTTAPTGTLANSGWQWQGDWGGFSGTPIAPQYFMTAQHVGGQVSQSFTFKGRTYTTTGFQNISSDLRVWKVQETFPTFAPLYTTTDELDKSFVFFGRGTPRGTPVVVGGVTHGWQWSQSMYDGVRRWGQNVVSGTPSLNSLNDSLAFTFTHNATNEGFMSFGDSGGGAFILSGGAWKFAGMAWAVQKEPWSYTPANDPNTTADDPFNAALTDQGGLYDWSTGSPVLVADLPSDNPMVGYLSRISPFASTIGAATTGSPTWNVDAGGNWSTTTNWWKNTVPSGTSAEAILGSINTAPRSVTLDTSRTVGTLTLDGPSGYTVAGTNTLTIQGASGTGLVRLYGGNHTIAAPLKFAGTTVQVDIKAANTSLSVSGALTATGVEVQKLGPGLLEVNNIRAASLDIRQGRVKVVPNGSNTGLSRVGTLSLAAGTTLDLNDNDLIIDTPAPGSFATIQSLIMQGYSDSWNPGKTGIISTTSQLTAGSPILALFDNALVGATEFPFGSGITIGSSAICGKYTYIGDADLNGMVTPDDYGAIDSHLGESVPAGRGWFAGDWNFDGQVTPDDYIAIDSNLGRGQGSPLAALSTSLAAVPEPASLSAVLISAGAVLTTRRRRCK